MKSKTKGQLLNQISEFRNNAEYYSEQNHKHLVTKFRNNMRLLQWVLGLRTRWYPEGEGLMQQEDKKAFEREKQLRKSLRMKN